jgi:SSS family solute:Na+ symporter
MKALFPGIPFVLRIGYVFIILSFVMVGLSLLDKKQKTVNIIDEMAGKKTIRIGAFLVAVAFAAGIIAAFFVYPMRHLALDAVYVLVTGFILIGLILIFNNTLKRRDIKGIILEKGLFKTSTTFNIAALGIIGILAALYICFW